MWRTFMRQVMSMFAAGIAMWLWTASPAMAQQGTGELRGRVLDQQGAVLPGVTVVAKNEASGQYREIVSGADGSFFMSALTPGSYEITAQLAGFKKYQRGGVVQAQELNDIPSINRNFTSYLSLLPGITATISTDSFGADSIRVNGQATQNANYTLDGAGNNDTFNNGNGGAQARIPVEAVQEFQVLTSQFDAEFGQSSGGIVNAVSRQGTNKVHGVAFFFESNQAMTSLDYF